MVRNSSHSNTKFFSLITPVMIFSTCPAIVSIESYRYQGILKAAFKKFDVYDFHFRFTDYHKTAFSNN